MYKIFLISLIILFTSCASKETIILKKVNTNKKQFKHIWNVVKSDPYKTLPNNKTSYFSLYKDNKSQILKDAKRTLTSKKDLLPYFNKLAHPNGICFKGTWNINKQNPYSGYFKLNTKALIIARASSALSNTKNNQIRTLGFAGKIFPTSNQNEIYKQNTANFFLIDDLGGTIIKKYTDSYLSNTPNISFNYEVFKNIFYALELKSAFEKADKKPNIRQVYEISQLKEKNKIITPKYMQIKAANEINNNKADFRDELSITNKDLVFNIYVANKIINKKKNWERIGNIILNESVVSESCDHRLHFSHPKYIEK